MNRKLHEISPVLINFNCFKYKTINGPAQPSATTATHTASDGATSFATFSQQLNQRHHSTPTAITPVKVGTNFLVAPSIHPNFNVIVKQECGKIR